MAMVGSLALHTDDDQEDSDFFDQLANEFGDGDLGHLQSSFQHEEKDRLDEAFSKLILGEEDSVPAPTSARADDALVSSLIAEDIGDAVGPDSWSKENDIEETAVESEASVPGDEVLNTAPHPPAELSYMDVPLAAATDHRPVNLHAKCSDGVETESLIVESANPIPMDITTAVEPPVQSVTGHTLEPFGLKDVHAPESDTAEFITDVPPCILPLETPELDSDPIGDNASKQGPHLIPVGNGSAFFCDEIPNVPNNHLQFEGSTVNSIDASSDCKLVEPGSAQSLPNVNVVGATGSPTVKELQWSSFGNSYVPNAFGSYSDFFSELGSEALIGSNQETSSQKVNPLSTILNEQGSLIAGGESFRF